MLDSRQRAELEELKKFLSNRHIWARIGLFISSLVSFSANGKLIRAYTVYDIRYIIYRISYTIYDI